MTPEIKQMIEREAEEDSKDVKDYGEMHRSYGYTAGRMKGVEEMEKFLEWCADNCIWRNGANGKWYSIRIKFDKDKTTTELIKLFYQQKEKAK